MHIGRRIKDLRTAKNMKVTELANKSFISQPYLSDIEKGRTTPSIDKLTAICDALEISLGEFFGYATDLSSDLIKLLETAKKLTAEERQKVTDMLETMLKRMDDEGL